MCGKIKIKLSEKKKISDGKMARFGLHAASSLIWGEGGISVPFYSVQDCRIHSLNLYLQFPFDKNLTQRF